MIFVTEGPFALDQTGRAMKNDEAPYKIVRVLRDGEELFVAGRENLLDAKKCAEKFLECWPGKYMIHGPESFNLVYRPGY